MTLPTFKCVEYLSARELMLGIRTEVLQAEQRIRPHIRETLLEYSLALSEIGRCNAFLKLENLQYTNSFKVRVLIEGAAGVVIASYLKHKQLYQGKNVVIVICGANISLETLKTVL